MDKQFDKQIRTKKLPDLDDDEFSVSITKAADLSGLSESQIRYLEVLPSISIGRRRPGERNRVYTKQDVRLLWWIAQQDARPSEIADYLKDHQEEVLSELGRISQQQVVDFEQSISGHDLLISRLVAILMSIWQEAASSTMGDAIIMSVIFGPQHGDWKTSFLESYSQKRPLDLANSLVVWSTFPKEDLSIDPNIIFGNLSIIFSRHSWYLPFQEEVIYDTSRFSQASDPFSVVILWLPLHEKTAANRRLEASVQYLNKSRSKKRLVHLLTRSLRLAIRRSWRPISMPTVVYSRGVIGRYAVKDCLSLILETCIRPNFPNCYSYVAKFEPNEQLELLAQCGDESSGYLPKAMAVQQIPWWIGFARNRASLALAKDVRSGPLYKNEQGSTVCLPLMVLDQVVGVLGIESVDKTKHCLVEQNGFSSADLLRYLICIAEIAAEYLNMMETSAQKAERSKLAYASDETVNWWLDIYQFGGTDYSRIVEQTYDWLEQVQVSAEHTVNLILVDIHNEGELAARYQGFEVVVDIVHKTKERIKELMQSDPVIAELVANKHLIFFEDPVGEHLLLAAVHIPRNYLLIFLEQIRGFWQLRDTMIWKRVEVKVVLQVGVCQLAGVAEYEKKVACQMMNYHLRKLAQQMYDRNQDRPFNHVIEYDAVVATEKIVE